ncbi:MAG: hypothetical protein HQL34_00670 [Alphaproteobacteria bacterium]|nr:hypothetical protein [Alphaproteobacteria bacterium]
MTTKQYPLQTTEEMLSTWIGNAFPGDALEYHRGFLALDGSPVLSRLAERDRHQLNRIANCALAAAANGLADLLQRRNGPDDFSYLIIARRRLREKTRQSHGLTTRQGDR